MVDVAARSAWVVGAGLVLALACGGKAGSDDVFDEPAAGGEAGEETTGGRASATAGTPNATGGSATGGVAAGGAVSDESGGEGGDQPAPARCGNAIVELPEECDDGNESDTDLCSNDCRFAVCGDGVVQTGEVCDDGNQSSTDYCSTNCMPPSCTDGVRQASEECDDGNANNNDDCLNTCTLPTCGDGILHNLGTGNEWCDDGEDNGPFPARCSATCSSPDGCGNGEPAPGQDCDDGDLNGDTASCRSECAWNVCGDGTAYLDVTPDTENPNAPHACDDANDDESDACTSVCAWNVCGDGVVFSTGYGEQYDSNEDGNELDDNPNSVEECDDGNDEAGDGCFECQLED